MNAVFWGEVWVFPNGKVKVVKHKDIRWWTTYRLPKFAKTKIAMLDFLPAGTDLPCGSNKYRKFEDDTQRYALYKEIKND